MLCHTVMAETQRECCCSDMDDDDGDVVVGQ